MNRNIKCLTLNYYHDDDDDDDVGFEAFTAASLKMITILTILIINTEKENAMRKVRTEQNVQFSNRSVCSH